MNYISLLNKEEVAILCNIISGKAFKEKFQKNSCEFAKLKPGFRVNKISPQDAVSLAIKNIDKPFIASFVNTNVQNWLKETEKSYTDMLSDGKEENEAMAEAVSESIFSDNIELYFKLAEKDVDESYLAKIREHVASSKEAVTLDVDASHKKKVKSSTVAASTDIGKQSAKDKQQIKEYESQLQQLKGENASIKQKLEDAVAKAHILENDNKEMEKEIAELKARAQYDDTDEVSTSATIDEYEHISLCEVTAPDYAGQVWLNRLADIDRDGIMTSFFVNEDMPKYFHNRDKLFFRDGPTTAGTVGVWNWNAIPNNNDSSRDYVMSKYNYNVEPIEIIIVRDCQNLKELLEKMTAGIDAEVISRRTIFAIYLSKGQYIGIHCRYAELEQNDNHIRLKKDVISLPQYDISRNDFRKLSNGKIYYRSLSIGMPSKVVNVKEPMDLVRTVILERNSWQMLKEQGKTRAEWKNIRNFLEGLDTVSLVDEISDLSNCSHAEAKTMLDRFVQHAEKYIDGTSIEDEVVSAVVASNHELQEHCKSLVKEEWLAENQTSVDTANAKLAELQLKIEQARTQKAKEYINAQEKIEKQQAEAAKGLDAMKRERDAVRQEHDKLEAELQAIEAKISAKEKFAMDVEISVEERIRQAQNNAAEFIAQLAFVPQARISVTENAAVPDKHELDGATEDHSCYVQGIELDTVDIQEVSSWKDMLDIISSNLIDAGVASELGDMSDVSFQLAAYMYAAYRCKSPLLLVGPNAGDIADAFSLAVFGKMAGVLDCTESYSAKSVEACYASEDDVVKIVNPFSANWISRIPDIVGNDEKFFIAVHPYAEDIQIEPRSLYNYMLPVLTELFIDKASKGNMDILAGKLADDYEEFIPGRVREKHKQLLIDMHTSLVSRKKIFHLLAGMHAMLEGKNIYRDNDVIFALLPYAYATMQTAKILEAVQDGPEKKIIISSHLQKLLNGLYGEDA